jgi:hypothetical protein
MSLTGNELLVKSVQDDGRITLAADVDHGLPVEAKLSVQLIGSVRAEEKIKIMDCVERTIDGRRETLLLSIKHL